MYGLWLLRPQRIQNTWRVVWAGTPPACDSWGLICLFWAWAHGFCCTLKSGMKVQQRKVQLWGVGCVYYSGWIKNWAQFNTNVSWAYGVFRCWAALHRQSQVFLFNVAHVNIFWASFGAGYNLGYDRLLFCGPAHKFDRLCNVLVNYSIARVVSLLLIHSKIWEYGVILLVPEACFG